MKKLYERIMKELKNGPSIQELQTEREKAVQEIMKINGIK